MRWTRDGCAYARGDNAPGGGNVDPASRMRNGRRNPGGRSTFLRLALRQRLMRPVARSSVKVRSPTTSVAKRVPLNVVVAVRVRLPAALSPSRVAVTTRVIVPDCGHIPRARGKGTTTFVNVATEDML